MEKINILKTLIDSSKNTVFFGGAGVSTESGIPDFRSEDGLYNLKYKYPPEAMLSSTFFYNKTDLFFDFYKNRVISYDAKPNSAHIALAKLEKEHKLSAVITQNIDGLHQIAGSKNVIELHGSSLRNFCTNCGKDYSIDYIRNSESVPKCTKCGGLIKPDVVLYGESLDSRAINLAVKYISEADLLIIGGTSLVVYPAASFIDYFKGDNIVLINKASTSRDALAKLIIREPIGEVFKNLL